MSRTTMQEEWENYEQQVVHPDAPDEQRTETQRAFMAGAWALLNWQIRLASDDLTDDVAQTALDTMHRELLAFGVHQNFDKADDPDQQDLDL